MVLLTWAVSVLRPIKSEDGSTDLVEFFFRGILLRLIALKIGDKVFISIGTLYHRVGITLKICKMELQLQVLPLMMKPTG